MVLRILSVLLHPMNFHDTEGPVYLMDTGKIRTHTPQHLNRQSLIPMGGNRPPRNLTIPEAKPIPLLTLQTDMTKVTKMTTLKQAVQTDPEARRPAWAWRSWRSQWSRGPRRSQWTWQQPPQRARLLAGIHESVAWGFHFVK